jgi:hypothetical protein
MQSNVEIKTSILMPGAFHTIESSFMSIYLKTDYRYCIMVEECTENGFMYDEYFVDVDEPSFFGKNGNSDYWGHFKLPGKTHQNAMQFCSLRF